jgi:transcriptional regulator with XRE-family HTH domain
LALNKKAEATIAIAQTSDQTIVEAFTSSRGPESGLHYMRSIGNLARNNWVVKYSTLRQMKRLGRWAGHYEKQAFHFRLAIELLRQRKDYSRRPLDTRYHLNSNPHRFGENMIIAERLKQIRESKKLSQGDIEQKTGLLRCYISRVENGHTVPAVQTLEKMANALGVPMYQLFFDGKPQVLKLPKSDEKEFGNGKDASEFGQFRRALSKIKKESDLNLLVFVAQKMHQKSERTGRKSKS